MADVTNEPLRDDQGKFAAAAIDAPKVDAPAVVDATAEEPKVDQMANPRNRAMADIVERRKAEVEAEIASDETPDDPPLSGADIPTGAAAPAVTEAGALPPASASEPVAAAPASSVDPAIAPDADYTFIVNGKPVKIKGSQVVARIQKDEAADYKLELASRLLNEAQQRAQPGPSAQDVQQHAQQPLAGKSDAELAQDMQFGTSEQATAAIAEIHRRATAAAVGEAQKVIRQAPAVVHDQLDIREAANFARTQYGDLLADPYLEPLFKMKVAEKLQAGGVSRADACKAVGDELRTHFNRPKPGAAPIHPQQPQPRTIEQRRELKASAPAAPRLASARLDGGEQPQLTPEQARQKGIEAMRSRTRGLRQARPS